MSDRPKLEHAPVPDPLAPRRKVSREGLVLIKSFEGFQPRAWRRPDGVWAIGYGHTRSAREGLTVSEADAELLLQYDLLPVVAALNDQVGRPLNQHQFDALASFALSLGVEAFLASDVMAALNAEGPDGAARALGARTDIDPALARAGRRRHVERALFEADPAAPVALAALLVAPEPPREVRPAAAMSQAEAGAAPEPDPGPAGAPPVPTDVAGVGTTTAYSLRYAAAVSHLLGEDPMRDPIAPDLPPAPAPVSEHAPPEATPPPGPAATAPVIDAPVADKPVAGEPVAEARPSGAVESEAVEVPAPPAEALEAPTGDDERRAVMVELMRRQMSPFAVRVTGPLPLAAPAPLAAAAPTTAPSSDLPPPNGAPELPGAIAVPEQAAEAGVDVDAALPPGALPIDIQAAPAAPPEPLVLTPPEPFEPAVLRPAWSPEERQQPVRSLETDLFSEEELAADLELRPVLRHEVMDSPRRRLELGQLGAYAGMGAVSLVSLGASAPALQALLDEGPGPRGENLLVFLALALIGSGCGGIAGFNLWRLWRDAHSPDVRDA